MIENRDRSEEVLAALRRIIRAIDLHSRSLVMRYGMTGPQLIVLKAIGEMPDSTVGQLARHVSLSSATVTSILDRLESRGMIERMRSPQDRRKVLVNLTGNGVEILEQSPFLLQERFVAEFGKIQDWEQTLILSSLQRVASLMEIEHVKAPPFLVSGAFSETGEEPLEAVNPEESCPDLIRSTDKVH